MARDWDDKWIRLLPLHAEEFAAQLQWLVPRMNAEEVLHRTASKLRSHAIYPENWPACNACKFEPMEETVRKALA